MITCQHCGNVMPNNALLCLACGTLCVFSRVDIDTPPHPELGSALFFMSEGEREALGAALRQPQPGMIPIPGTQAFDSLPTLHSPVAQAPTATPLVPVSPSVNKGALIVEVTLNLCLGLFGIGWLMAGESLTGLLLLTCSLVLYWPTLLIGFFLNVIFSVGPGLYGLIPLALGTVALNLYLLRKTLRHNMEAASLT